MLWFAFLRAVNVGGRTIKMDRLKELFAGLGYTNVQTYIQSGNGVFETGVKDRAALTKQIEAMLADALGYEVPTFLRTADELAALAETNPFGVLPDKQNVLYVSFLPGEPDEEAAAKMLAHNSAIDSFHLQGAHLYWLSRKGVGDTDLTNAHVERYLGMPASRRNMNTIKKMAGKYLQV